LIVTFTADGNPRTKGSYTIQPIGKTGRHRLAQGKTKGEREALESWVEFIQVFGTQAMGGRALLDGPLRAEVVFVLPRPKSVTRRWPHSQADGDLDKYERAAFDACEGIVYTNDARICVHGTLKRYADPSAGERPHATFTFTELE
jgi:Holliday junction resolvase RusA-like endonuclease